MKQELSSTARAGALKEYRLKVNPAFPEHWFLLTNEQKGRVTRWVLKSTQSPEQKPTTSPKNVDRRPNENLNRLVPDWVRRRRLFSIKEKTLLRIYLSKWFYKGLEWNEIILLESLLCRTREDFIPLFEKKKYFQVRGIELVFNLYSDMENDPIMGLHGEFLLGTMQELLFSEQDFYAVWKLRSFQSLRDYIFQPLPVEEHEGKRGIIKPRIRGYRDGKASPRDPLLTTLARQLDVLFHEEIHEKRWERLFGELNGVNDLVAHTRDYFELIYRSSQG